jgi:hypothetical protein
LFDYGGTLSELDPRKVNNVENAVQNARAFVGEVLSRLKELQDAEDVERERRATA